MARIKRGMMKNKRRSKILGLAKGFRNARSTKYKQAKQAVVRAGQHSFAHRRRKKRVMRKLWQIKISYAVQNLTGLSYSKFIDQLTKANVAVDRKIMSNMIETDMDAFSRFLTGAGFDVDTNKVNETKTAVKEIKEEKEEAVTVSDVDDLTKIEGIGPKIAEVLAANGIATFAALADAKDADTQDMIKDVKGNHQADSWNEQAALARDGKWDELKTMQDALDGGVEK